MHPTVDAVIAKSKVWRDEFLKLQEIILESGLEEQLKWGQPCYSLNNKNVVLIHGFKEYCAILFMKGALLRDPKKILIQQTENVQSARQMRFTSLSQINKLVPQIRAYVKEAIEVEKAGLKVELKKTTEYEVVDEFQQELQSSKSLQAAFSALTPGRQRAYLMYFSSAKQAKTRIARIEKCKDLILAGKGLNDE